MDTVQLSPRVKFPAPRAISWFVVAFGALLVFFGWAFQDLWRALAWPSAHFDLDDSPPRDVLRNIALLGLILLALIVACIVIASTHHWEAAIPAVMFILLYCGLTLLRLLK